MKKLMLILMGMLLAASTTHATRTIQTREGKRLQTKEGRNGLLLSAIFRQNVTDVQEMLSMNVDPNIMIRRGRGRGTLLEPSHFLCVVDPVESNKYDCYPLLNVALGQIIYMDLVRERKAPNLEIVQLLVEDPRTNVNVCAVSKFSKATPLHYFIHLLCSEIPFIEKAILNYDYFDLLMQFLVDRNTNPTSINSDGKKPVDILNCVRETHPLFFTMKVVKELLEYAEARWLATAKSAETE